MKLNYKDLFLIFIIGCVLGSFYEIMLNFFEMLFKTGKYIIEYRQTVLYGPFNIVYGLGAVSVAYLSTIKRFKWYELIILSAFICGFIEFVIHYLQDIYTHTYFWDYSNKILNINGRTTIIYALFWGIFSYLFLIYLYPSIYVIIRSIKVNVKNYLVFSLIIFMSFNIIFSTYAMKRYYERNNNYYIYSTFNKAIDYLYDDYTMKRTFPHLSIKK